jgi:hypothetical protein
LLDHSAAKLWNTAMWHAKEAWKTTGKVSPGVAIAWRSLRSAGLPGEKPGYQCQPINRGRGKHPCRIGEQNQ